MSRKARRDTYTFPSLEDLAAAYEVTYDSMIDVVWSGAGELVPAGAELRALPPAPSADPPGWAPGRIAADRSYFNVINERRVELASRGIAYPSGAQMFGAGTEDAKAWDGAFAHVPVGDRVWGIADMRRRAAERAAGDEANSHTALCRGLVRTAIVDFVYNLRNGCACTCVSRMNGDGDWSRSETRPFRSGHGQMEGTTVAEPARVSAADREPPGPEGRPGPRERGWVLDEAVLEAVRNRAYAEGWAACKAARCRLAVVPGA